jgi:hypothetical protein
MRALPGEERELGREETGVRGRLLAMLSLLLVLVLLVLVLKCDPLERANGSE